MSTILVTGANGFVGVSLCALLAAEGYQVKAAIRSAASITALNVFAIPVVIGEIDVNTDWQVALMGVDVVVHLAARVHVMRETAIDPLRAFEQVNAEGTQQLARQAAEAGVKRFILLSSIKVLGEFTEGEAFGQGTSVAPQDPYAQSKWAAEQFLWGVSHETGMEAVVIRPPLVYGLGVKGNFLRLVQLVKQGWPLPFAAIRNKRSLVYVENLCALISVCLTHSSAAGQTLLIADTEVYTTPELIKELGVILAVPVRLWAMPVWMLKGLASLLGKFMEISRLCDSLEVDATHTYQLLNWHPPYTTQQGLVKMLVAPNAQDN